MKKPLCIILILLLILFSCTSKTEKTFGQSESKSNYQNPKLIQHEISPDDLSAVEEYSLYNSIVEEGPIIPGIFQAAVPQGMAYNEKADLMFISNYMFDGRPSCITVVSMKDDLLKKTLWLLNPDGSFHMGHVGGLSVSNKYLWISSGNGVYYISLDTLGKQSDNSTITMEKYVSTAVKGSFSGFSDGILMVGEFTSRDGAYTVPGSHYFKTADGNTNHSWLAGFVLQNQTDLIDPDHQIDNISYPDFILSIPDQVQGVAFIDDKIILSRSYGRRNNSRISIYRDIRKDPSDTSVNIKDGRSIPVWILDPRNFEREIVAPPMTEGIVNYKGRVAVLFESGSDKYRATAKNPQSRIGILNVDNPD